jgi:hypothetical protein
MKPVSYSSKETLAFLLTLIRKDFPGFYSPFNWQLAIEQAICRCRELRLKP